MRCRTIHETSKRTRTIHLRIATFSAQSGLWHSTHHGFHSYEHQTWKADGITIEAALHIVRMHAFHPPCAYILLRETALDSLNPHHRSPASPQGQSARCGSAWCRLCKVKTETQCVERCAGAKDSLVPQDAYYIGQRVRRIGYNQNQRVATVCRPTALLVDSSSDHHHRRLS